jgi:hypothetical protein
MAADLTLDIWLKAHDQYSGVFQKWAEEAEGLRGKIGLLAGGFGALAGGVLAESVKQASGFQTMVNHVPANTTMTTQGIKEMSAALAYPRLRSGYATENVAAALLPQACRRTHGRNLCRSRCLVVRLRGGGSPRTPSAECQSRSRRCCPAAPSLPAR